MAGEWTTFRLGDVCSKIGSGATPRGGGSVYLEHGDIALIRSQNVYNDGFHYDGITYLTEEHAAELANVEVAEHDVLLNITGDSVARSCQVDADVLPARVNQHVAIIRPDPTVLWPRFLRYFLVSPAMQAEMLSLAGAGATRNALTKGMIESFEVPAPKDIDEQRAIAHILGTLDDKIEMNRRMNETLEAMARATFKSWFVDFDTVRAKTEGRKPAGMDVATAALFPDSFQDSGLGKIPQRWQIATISQLAELNAQALSKKDELDQIQYIEISEVVQGNIQTIQVFTRGQEPSRAKRRLCHGDTVLSTVRPERGSYFLCLNPPHNLIASTGFAVVSARKAPWSFVYAALTQPEVFDHLGRHAHGGAYPAVAPEVIGEWSVAWPEKPGIVDAFHRICAPLYERAERNRLESRTLAAIRDALLPKLITGELRLADPAQFITRHTE